MNIERAVARCVGLALDQHSVGKRLRKQGHVVAAAEYFKSAHAYMDQARVFKWGCHEQP